MQNPNPPRRIKRWLIPSIIILLLAVLLAIFLRSRYSPLHFCTLIGCNNSLKLVFNRPQALPYTITVTSDTGETRSATCAPGQDGTGTSSQTSQIVMCQPSSVTFYNFNPQQISIEINWSGARFSESGQPTYTSSQPNGPDCPPTCYSGTFSVNIP